jgi:hypothetical protein
MFMPVSLHFPFLCSVLSTRIDVNRLEYSFNLPIQWPEGIRSTAKLRMGLLDVGLFPPYSRGNAIVIVRIGDAEFVGLCRVGLLFEGSDINPRSNQICLSWHVHRLFCRLFFDTSSTSLLTSNRVQVLIVALDTKCAF